MNVLVVLIFVAATFAAAFLIFLLFRKKGG